MVGEKMLEDFIQIGRIANTHGVRGEIKIIPLTNDMHRFNYLKTAFLGEEKIKVEVENVKYHKNLVIVKFKEFNDINEIISFKDEYVYIEGKDKVVLPEDHYFLYDIVNCEVFDTQNNYIGIVKEVLQSASNDIYIVKDKKGKEYLIPAVKEFFIDIDVENKKIIIDPIEGMIE
ncbi:MAG: 16S rRNA processing protein RimM [Tissierellia bacterium]|nr:16S rRNA processing protein RimM [Tissierellia bacterium]